MTTQTAPVLGTGKDGFCLDCGAPLLEQEGCRQCAYAECFVVGALRAYAPDHPQAKRGVALTLGAREGESVASSAQQFRLVYELDVSFASLRRPTQRPKQEVRLKVADVLRLPFADGSLSAVVSEYLLNRLPDPVGAATEIRRVLKSGGIWVNLSRRLRPVARPGVLESLGLAVARCEPLQFASADSCRKDAEDRRVQEVQFFVARKVLGHTAILVAGWPASYGWWQWIVRAVQAGRMRMACRRKCGA